MKRIREIRIEIIGDMTNEEMLEVQKEMFEKEGTLLGHSKLFPRTKVIIKHRNLYPAPSCVIDSSPPDLGRDDLSRG